MRGIIRFATTFSNAAYMGFPLIQAMYGSEGVLYASVYVTVFNILLWTVGIVYVSESMSFKELLKRLLHAHQLYRLRSVLLYSLQEFRLRMF